MGYNTMHTLTFSHPVTGETVDMADAAPDWDFAPWTDEVFEDCEADPAEVGLGALGDEAIRPILLAMSELDPRGDGFRWLGGDTPWKWYSHTEDMKKLSAWFPAVLFTLEGRGSSSEDVWREYHKAGKVQVAHAQFVIPAFDETLLK